jgi:hypothetical protein
VCCSASGDADALEGGRCSAGAVRLSRASCGVQARNPPKPVEVEVYEDGTNEWIKDLNGDVGGGKPKAKKEKKPAEGKAEGKKKKPAKVE